MFSTIAACSWKYTKYIVIYCHYYLDLFIIYSSCQNDDFFKLNLMRFFVWHLESVFTILSIPGLIKMVKYIMYIIIIKQVGKLWKAINRSRCYRKSMQRSKEYWKGPKNSYRLFAIKTNSITKRRLEDKKSRR